MCIGYPMGGTRILSYYTILYNTIQYMQGDNICVTRGIVSRVTTLPYEDQKYGMLSKELLAIQVCERHHPDYLTCICFTDPIRTC